MLVLENGGSVRLQCGSVRCYSVLVALAAYLLRSMTKRICLSCAGCFLVGAPGALTGQISILALFGRLRMILVVGGNSDLSKEIHVPLR